MVFRAAELESGEEVESLEELRSGEANRTAQLILDLGEDLEGDWGERARYNKLYERWHSRLYFDPISHRPFEMSTIDAFRR